MTSSKKKTNLKFKIWEINKLTADATLESSKIMRLVSFLDLEQKMHNLRSFPSTTTFPILASS